MIESPRIVSLPPLAYAALHLTIPKPDIRKVMGPGLAEVHAALAAQGVAAAGPWFTHHFRMEPARWDFEIALPVAAPFAPAGRVALRSRPALEAAVAVLCGDYAGLAAAWPALDAWVAAQGRVGAGDLWEVYVLGPEANADPAAWRTELVRPLRAP